MLLDDSENIRNWQVSSDSSLRLPIVRTSVNHGTTFDIAGTGAASPASLAAAIRRTVHFSSAAAV